MKYRVSVVVAVYNMERYIRQCIDSVLNQTLREVQLILVDDVSTDGTPDILQEYAHKDFRVKVIQQENNGGAQLARNAGIAVAEGDYIMTLDHDDWLSPDALETALTDFQRYPDTECLVLKEVRVRPDGTQYIGEGRRDFGAMSGKEAFMESMPWRSVSGRLIVTADLQRRFLFNNSDRIYGEDVTCRLMFLSQKVVRSTMGIYYHRILPDSLSHAVNLGVISSARANTAMSKILRDEAYDEDVRRAHEEYRWRKIVHAYFYYWMKRRYFSRNERSLSRHYLIQARRTVDFSLIPSSLLRKFGYMKMPAWGLFALQEELYFALRAVVGRNHLYNND